jgi:hypothetical protein
MVFDITFSAQEIEQLFLTYRDNPQNYEEIKQRLYGKGAMREFKNSMRARRIFILILGVIAILSSVFSFFAAHWGSMGAIWIIWTVFSTAIAISMYVSYKHSFLVMQRNESFFKEFEQIAKQSESLEDFIIDWNLKGKKLVSTS